MKTTTSNPLLDEYRRRLEHAVTVHPRGVLPGDKLPSWYGCWQCKEYERRYETEGKIRTRYSYAVPDDGVLDLISRYSPQGIVEVGAGLGYWAAMLHERGVDVVAYDISPEGNAWQRGEPWFPVLTGGPENVQAHPDRTLLLCWPPMSDMASRTLEIYRGEVVVYVGEHHGGATADDVFHEALEDNWDEVDMYDHPQWWGLYDHTFVYRRKGERAG